MGKFKVGDIVARKSYGLDILFRVVDVKCNTIEDDLTLKGITYRIEADAPESDLMLQPDMQNKECRLAEKSGLQKECRRSSIKGKSRIFR